MFGKFVSGMVGGMVAGAVLGIAWGSMNSNEINYMKRKLTKNTKRMIRKMM